MSAKPFIKWVGGKSQLISQLEQKLPIDFDSWKDVTYIEPFVGGGAMLFHMLQNHPNITHAVINDININLITCYRVIRDNPQELITALTAIQDEYYALPDEDARRAFFLERRSEYNRHEGNPIRNTVLFFFLNRTCFNGLYRVNKKGAYNVPFGRYNHPTICDAQTVLEDSALLQRVEILDGDYQQTLQYAVAPTLFYFDPPYRPLDATSSFNDYNAGGFGDTQQLRLRDFCNEVNACGHHFIQSNADCSARNPEDLFFEREYANFHISRVLASRNINSNPEKRGQLSELLIRNFNNPE